MRGGSGECRSSCVELRSAESERIYWRSSAVWICGGVVVGGGVEMSDFRS